MASSPREKLNCYLSNSKANGFTDPKFALFMDTVDPLKHLRNYFVTPKVKDVIPTGTKVSEAEGEKDSIYLCGNSLGLMPKKSRHLVDEQLENWGQGGVKNWLNKPKADSVPWVQTEELVVENLAAIVGAKPSEVTVNATLTVNLHTLLTTYYKPTTTRHKILLEANAFPSDHYAIESHIRWHGLNVSETMVCLSPREGEDTIRNEDICKYIEEHGDSIAIVLFPGIQYYTGQFFNIPKITATGKAKGCIVGWDLAHAVGNVKLELHAWNVDFAVWCTYKYLNSGPGGIGGLFVSENLKVPTPAADDMKYANRLAGWWAGDTNVRFLMKTDFEPRDGAAGFKQSTTSILLIASLMGSLDVFSKTNMNEIRAKSELLTGYLELLLKNDAECCKVVKIITPENPAERGAQLSLKVPRSQMTTIMKGLEEGGVVFDERQPECIRIAPVPLYNKFQDVLDFYVVLKNVLKKI